VRPEGLRPGEAGVLKAIMLDFDGVVLESVDIKTRALRSLFKDYPSKIDEIVRIHREMAGISRFEKFKIIYRDILHKPLTVSEIERLDQEFSVLVAREIFTCPFVTGALEFLEEQSRRLPIFVVSGTPEGELRDIVVQRDLDRYCHGVYGSPRTKDVLLRQVIAENHWQPSEVVFVGDSLTDYEAASRVDVHFIARVADGQASPFPDSVRWVVPDLQNLADRWTSVLAHFHASAACP
jgi:phosphoglycolate phosphatase-like HAD superfamily hydrolase